MPGVVIAIIFIGAMMFMLGWDVRRGIAEDKLNALAKAGLLERRISERRKDGE